MPSYQLDLGPAVIVGSARNYLKFVEECEDVVLELHSDCWYQYQNILSEARKMQERWEDSQADSQISLQKDQE